MRIVQLASNFRPVEPMTGKAISSHTAWLTNGLVKRGHDVHLFASSDSQTNAKLHAVSDSLWKQDLDNEMQGYLMRLNVSRAYEYARDNADIIHSHFNLLSSTLFSPLITTPSLISIHTPIPEHVVPYANQFKNERFVSFTLAQRKQLPELNWYANIYHGVEMNVFTFNEKPKDYLLYLGRITGDKGTHHAIAAAKAAGVPLLIAGTSYPNEGYWQKEIEPHINGVTVRYVGEASFEEKIGLFQNARALLFPTQVSEVFGYAMIEAMACGTPVIGFNNGSVPEIVKHGVTGFVVNDVEEMTEAIRKIDTIDRKKVRQRAQTFFSVEKMIAGYENVYKRILNDTAYTNGKQNGGS